MILKLSLCLCVMVGMIMAADWDNTKPIALQKTFHREHFDRLLEQNEELNVHGSAVVLKSNLPERVQKRLAILLTSIYNTTSEPMQRAQQFQTDLSRMYSVYWSVVIDFTVISFYSQYYILLQIDSDRVLGFGMS